MKGSFKTLLMVVCLIFSTTIYSNNIDNLDYLLMDFVPLKYKLEYLDSIKNIHSFSTQDIEVLEKFLNLILEESSEELKGLDTWKNSSKNVDNDKLRNNILCSILEILLKEDVNEDILKRSLLSKLTASLIPLFSDKKNTKQIPSKIKFLGLKVLIKINMLKSNSDDDFSQESREIVIRSLEDIKDAEELIEENNNFYEKRWQMRDVVEGYIFEPILSEKEQGSIDPITYLFPLPGFLVPEKDEQLYEYEKYLLEHLKYFSINDNLKSLVERSFFKTQYKEFKTQYIDAMFSLDMRETLIKIIKDKSIEDNLRQKAIEVSVKLLDQLDDVFLKIFAKSLLKSLEQISTERRSSTTLKKQAEDSIKLITSKFSSLINKQYDIKDLELVIFNPLVSVEEKMKYLNDIVGDGFYFKKQDLGFVKKVFNQNTLDYRIKARVALIVSCTSTYEDVVKSFEGDDFEKFKNLEVAGMINLSHCNDSKVPDWFLNSNENSYSNVNEALGIADIEDDENDIIEKIIEFYYQMGVWKKLVEKISLKSETDSNRKLAMQKSLDLLTKTKEFDEFSDAFLEALKDISEDPQESHDLRNIADCILQSVKSNKLSLKENNCSFKFLFKNDIKKTTEH